MAVTLNMDLLKQSKARLKNISQGVQKANSFGNRRLDYNPVSRQQEYAEKAYAAQNKSPVAATPNNATNTFTQNSPTPGSYITNDNKMSQGTIKGGIAYGANNQPVPMESVVNTQGGQYVKGPYGGFGTSQNTINSLDKRMYGAIDQYAAAQQAYEDKINASVALQLQRIRAQANDVANQNAQANQQTYNAYLQASNPYGAMAQRNEAIGLGNSGYAESSQVALGNAYQQAMQANEAQKQKQMFEIEQAMNEAQLSGDYEKANALAAYADNLLQTQMQAAQTSAGYNMQATQMGINSIQQSKDNDYRNQTFDYGKQRDQVSDTRYSQEWAYKVKQDKINQYMSYLNAGFMPPDAASILGIPPDQLNTVHNAAMQRYKTPVYSASRNTGGGRGNRSTKKRNSSRKSSVSSGNGGYTPKTTAVSKGDTNIERSVNNAARGENITDPKEIKELYRYQIVQQMIADAKKMGTKAAKAKAKALMAYYGITEVDM